MPNEPFWTVSIWSAIARGSSVVSAPACAAAIASAHLARSVGVVQSPAGAISG